MTEVTEEKPKRGRAAAASVENAEDAVENADGRAGATTAGGKKLRLVLSVEENSGLNSFLNTMRDRGVKTFKVGDIITEALATVSKDWWDAKVDEMTPLEWKLHAALGNPEMRAKLMSLLEGKS